MLGTKGLAILVERKRSDGEQWCQHSCYVLYSLGGLLESDVVGEATDLAGDPLHALLALDDGAVDVVHALDHVGQRVGS